MSVHIRKTTDGRVLVDLCMIEGSMPILIVEQPGTGVIYENQTGGTSCNHPQVEGYSIPVWYWNPTPHGPDDMLGQLEKITYDMAAYVKPGDGPKDGWITGDLESKINDMLLDIIPGWQLDPERLHMSEEAWLYVKREDGLTGVLTYQNSD